MSSDWIKHVKQYAKEHKIKYGEALKQASSTFHSSAEQSNMMVVKSRKVRKVRKSHKNRSRRNRTARRS
jgi:hypothetical protein